MGRGLNSLDINTELEKGYADMLAGHTVSLEQAFAEVLGKRGCIPPSDSNACDDPENSSQGEPPQQAEQAPPPTSGRPTR